MDIVYAVHGHAPGVARLRIRIDDSDGDVLAVAVDTVPPAWAAAGDVLLREDSETAALARVAARTALIRHPGATAVIAAHPAGHVMATRARTLVVAAKRRPRPESWSSRLSVLLGTGNAQLGVEGTSFGEAAGAFLLSAALKFDVAERGEDLCRVVRGIERPHRTQ